jgi:small subunit ribosomal protein S6
MQQRIYEVMFIVRPDMVDEDMDKLVSSIETQVTTAGGTVKSMEKMGKRRLAYWVGGFQDGFYMLLTVEGGGALVHEIERRLRVTEPVLKFITVRMDEEIKRMEKMKKLRDAKKRAVPVQAAPPVAAEAAPAEPAPATPATA